MNRFFAKVPEATDEPLEAYLQFLEQRNGTLDPTGPYPKREAWLNGINASPVRSAEALDPELFQLSWSAFGARAAENQALTALLAFVKVNAGEAYGVEAVGRARHGRPMTGGRVDQLERLLIKEEDYHTRILKGAVHAFGVGEPKAAYRPPAPVRMLIGTLVHAPGAFFHPVLLAAEVGGLFTFNWMLKRVGELFAGQPALRELLEERLLEIITDEIGHVAFNRLAVGQGGLWAAKKLAPEVSHSTAGMTPEFKALGWSRDVLRDFDAFDLSSLPERARRAAFFV